MAHKTARLLFVSKLMNVLTCSVPLWKYMHPLIQVYLQNILEIIEYKRLTKAIYVAMVILIKLIII